MSRIRYLFRKNVDVIFTSHILASAPFTSSVLARLNLLVFKDLPQTEMKTSQNEILTRPQKYNKKHDDFENMSRLV